MAVSVGISGGDERVVKGVAMVSPGAKLSHAMTGDTGGSLRFFQH